MTGLKILFINLGYARGIAGKLSEHIRYAHRHFYCSPVIQKQSLQQLNKLIEKESPDLCCFVEIDQGVPGASAFNQIDFLRNDHYRFSDVENKYAPKSVLRSIALTSGKSNAFLSKQNYSFEKLYFSRGIKRLVYKIKLTEKLTLFFAHFSLNKIVRAQQIIEARDLMRGVTGEVIFLGDFNILTGLQEIGPLLDKEQFVLLNKNDLPTFFFHKKQSLLDLCLCSVHLSKDAQLRVLPQTYTDHAALILQLGAA